MSRPTSGEKNPQLNKTALPVSGKHVHVLYMYIVYMYMYMFSMPEGLYTVQTYSTTCLYTQENDFV